MVVHGRRVQCAPIDQAAVRSRLAALGSFSGGQLRWELNGDWVRIHISPTCVVVTHNTGRGSAQIDVMINVLDALQRCGLFVYDPQQGKWLDD